LHHTLPEDLFVPVYFDLQDQASRPLGEVLADLADAIAESLDKEPPDPKLFDDRGLYFLRNFLDQSQEDLDRRRLVLLLDEFDVLDQTAEAELDRSVATKLLFPFLRRLMLEKPQLAFVFVVGRRAEDLTLDFHTTFKASLTREIWILDEESAVTLIRQAEANQTLRFSDQAVQRILALTNRHPYLTQLLCQRIWELARAGDPDGPVEVDLPLIETAVDDALDTGYQAFSWLWEGLSPAEKIYIAAFAEIAAEGNNISEDQVIQVLTTHAARLRTREVELAPRDLVRRRILVQADEGSYRFSIELFQRWVQYSKPLREVKDELDRIDPLAERTYDIGVGFMNRRQREMAIRYFQDALAINPSHFRARLSLGETLLTSGQTVEALKEMQLAYELDQDEARLPLARALVSAAKAQVETRDEDGALKSIDRALVVSPQEQAALALKTTIWIRRGEQALQQDDHAAALVAYQRAGDREKIAQVEAQQLNQELNELERQAEVAEEQGEPTAALANFEALLARAPADDVRIAT
jgi:tetratricopeptide (TPR) repeat protein